MKRSLIALKGRSRLAASMGCLTLIASLAALQGCSSPIVPVTKIVYVHDNTKALKAYEKGVHEQLAIPCPATAPRAQIATVNDVISGLNRDQNAADCRQTKINAIQTLAPPPASN